MILCGWHNTDADVRRSALSANANRSARRRGFTLVELLVSLAIMSLALTVVGVVFAVTTQTATKAGAISEVSSWLHQFEQEIRADLAECDPTQSVMVVVGRTIPTALTEDDLAAEKYWRVMVGNAQDRRGDNMTDVEFAPTAPDGWSDARADVLSFFSQRRVQTADPPTETSTADDFHRALANGAKFGPIQVVYGHGAYWDPQTGLFVQPGCERRRASTAISALPAQQWHLARRAAILRARNDDPSNPYTYPNTCTTAELEPITFCADGSSNNDRAADVLEFDYQRFLRQFGVAMAEARGDQPTALLSPYDYDWIHASYGIRELLSPGYVTDDGGLVQNAWDGDRAFVAAIIKEPSEEYRSNLGSHMLPGCAWFKVEFLMPEDPRNSKDYSTPNASDPQYSRRYDPLRWVEIPDGEVCVFAPDTAENREAIARDPGRLGTFARLDQEPGNDISGPVATARKIRLWPYAIRITVKVFDPNGRLDEPLERTIVHWFE